MSVLGHVNYNPENATLKEVNTSIAQKIVGCISLSIEKWIIFLKFLEFNSFWEHP